MRPSAKSPRLEARQPSANSCLTPITSTYISTVTRVIPSTTIFERYVTDSQADKTTIITQTILEAIERTTTAQLPVVTSFCASSSNLTTSSSIPIDIDRSTSVSYASSFLPSPTSTTTAPTASLTSDSASQPPPSKTPAIISAATIPIVVFIMVMFTFCFFRRRTEETKIEDLEHIAIEPQTPAQPKPVPFASTAFGTTAIGEYIPEDSISFVQHTNPPNPVDHSLESIVAPSQIQHRFTAQSSADLYQQFSTSLPRPEEIRYDPVPSDPNIIQAARAAKTSDDIHQPIPPSPLSVAINQLPEMANQDTITFNPLRAAINRSLEMETQQPQGSRPPLVAIGQVPDLADYQPTAAQPHHNITEAIMDLSHPVAPIPQTPPPSEASRQRSLTDALCRLEGEPARLYSTTGFDWRNHRQLGSRDPSLSTVPQECDDDDVPLAELQERLRGRAQQAMYRQNGGQELRDRDADEAIEAATQRRRAREGKASEQMAIRSGNLPDIARMARQEEAATQGQYRPRGVLPNARKERQAVVRHGQGTRDRGYDADAAETAGQSFTAQDMRAGIEERERQRQLQMRFYGGLPQDAHMVRGGGGDGHRLDTRGRIPPVDDYNAFLATARQRERAEEEERELRKQIAEGVESRQKSSEERRERIRGEGVTDTRLTDFDVDAVNRQTANQPPRSRPMNVGRLDGSQAMPHAMPRPNKPDLPPKAHMRRSG